GRCIEMHLRMARMPDEDAASVLGTLIDVGRVSMPEGERYRALLIARAAVRTRDTELLARADVLLAQPGDAGPRSLVAGPRAAAETPIGEADRPGDARGAAALAAAHADRELAAKVDARAAAIERALAVAGPYRR